jgi:tRNA(fMet)-specific endonuclease VapC
LLADTTFLIDLMERRPEAIEKARELEKKSVAIQVSSPSIFELYVGLSLSKRAIEEKSKIVSVVETLPQLPLDIEAARVAGTIYAEKRKAGLTIDPEDAITAGVAKVNGETILTRNTKHFSNIEGVKTESY